MSDIYISASQLQSTNYACIAIASLFFLLRSGLRLRYGTTIQTHDVFALLSWMVFVPQAVLYIVYTPTFYRVIAEADNLIPPFPPGVNADIMTLQRILVVSTLLFWTVVWSVKLSLMFLFKNLFNGLLYQQRRWWIVFVFIVITYIICIVGVLTVCGIPGNIVAFDECRAAPSYRRRLLANLYYTFAFDVLTDIMIMILPLRHIFALRLPLIQRLSISVIFCFGIFCIIASIIRTARVAESGERSSLGAVWIAFWQTIEGGVAVVVGCLPAFAVIYRQLRNENNRRHQCQSSSDTPTVQHPQSIPLSTPTTANKTSQRKVHIEATRATYQSPGASQIYHDTLRNPTGQENGTLEDSDLASSELSYNDGALWDVP